MFDVSDLVDNQYRTMTPSYQNQVSYFIDKHF